MKVWGSGSNLSNLDVVSKEPPLCYVQQIVLRTAVIPWDTNLRLGDAFRAPLYEAFKLLDIVRNFQDTQRYSILSFQHLQILHSEFFQFKIAWPSMLAC